MLLRVLRGAVLLGVLVLTSCGTLITAYDSYFDQSLNRLSEDVAKFIAAAKNGGPERLESSKQTVSFYAGTYDLLDRLSQRARLGRGLIACPVNAELKVFSERRTSTSKLPDDYLSFDCREFQLYALRYYFDQMKYMHRSDGVLNPDEGVVSGDLLQVALLGTIQTFLVNKP